MIRFQTIAFLVVLTVLASWNFRLQRENRRLATMLKTENRRKSPPPPLPVGNPELAGRIQDERDAVDALAQRLHEIGVPDVSGLKRAIANQTGIVADLQVQLKRLLASRPAQLDVKAQRAQLNEQIDAELRLILQLKAKATRYKTSNNKEHQAEVPTLIAQIEAETQVVNDLKEQRRQLAKAPRQPAAMAPENAEQKAEREKLESQLHTETERLNHLREQFDSAAKSQIDPEARLVQQELEKHQNTLRQLESQAKNQERK